MANAKKGILIDGGNNNIFEDLLVHTIQEEGIHFRFFSSDNIVRNCTIRDTGKVEQLLVVAIIFKFSTAF